MFKAYIFISLLFSLVMSVFLYIATPNLSVGFTNICGEDKFFCVRD